MSIPLMYDRRMDTLLVSNRQRINELYGTFDFDAWILEVAKPHPSESVLDLGCGRGKHIVLMVYRVGTNGTITGVDISEESLTIARKLCKERRLPNVRLVKCSLDDVPSYFEGQQFDLILSSYAIYYSSNQVQLIQKLAKLLKPHGRIFFCGNDANNNQELVDLLNNLKPIESVQPYKPFISCEELTHTCLPYQHSFLFHKVNKIVFPSPDEVINYWKACSLYRSQVEDAFRDAIFKHFKDNTSLTMTKRILGVMCYVH